VKSNTTAVVVVITISIITSSKSSRECRPALACLLSVDTIANNATITTIWCNKETKGKRGPASKQQ